MTHRDRLGDPPGRRGAAGDVGPRVTDGGKASRRTRRLAQATGTAATPNLVYGGFRAA
jgi:hypothetical protein